ncbi:chitin-binding type-2 domain-containing protein [Trichonephila inaurata madagascariensis]|uniref:Chitin-binding type-2 domain-containing protein n=1 Tax=Trichonephila inaurata madagascariensis TaxID=2747483 RepID=A0A8X6IJH1_9ARAC|nr:chitin-binding type-2 domain-containing protein [Trichonephila inaurata madagascariensis]
MKELESEYPEIKAMKRELLKKLHTYSSRFDSKLNRDESIILRLLAFVINVAEKLKVDYTKIIHEKEIAKPITIDPMPVEEIIAEDDYAPFVGSIRGIPGVHYPDYSEIPVTSFTCSDKKYVPGFYADLETGCQVPKAISAAVPVVKARLLPFRRENQICCAAMVPLGKAKVAKAAAFPIMKAKIAAAAAVPH